MKNNLLINFMEVSAQRGIKSTKKDLKNVLENFIGFLKEELEKAENEIVLPKIGKFSFVIKSSRTLKHPKTGVSHKIPEKKVVKFKVSANIKESVASKTSTKAKKK